jgi:hypothetical protein
VRGGGIQVLAVAVYNHYQRLKHEDAMTQIRKEREAAARADSLDDYPDPHHRSLKHPDHTPYPPSQDTLNLMSDRQPFTRNLFGAHGSYEARYAISSPSNFNSLFLKGYSEGWKCLHAQLSTCNNKHSFERGQPAPVSALRCM